MTYGLERKGQAILRRGKTGRHGIARTIFLRQRCQLAIQQKRLILALFESGDVEAECSDNLLSILPTLVKLPSSSKFSFKSRINFSKLTAHFRMRKGSFFL